MTCDEQARARAALKKYEDEVAANPFADVSQACTVELYDALRDALLALEAEHHPANDPSHVMHTQGRGSSRSYPELAKLVNRDQT